MTIPNFLHSLLSKIVLIGTLQSAIGHDNHQAISDSKDNHMTIQSVMGKRNNQLIGNKEGRIIQSAMGSNNQQSITNNFGILDPKNNALSFYSAAIEDAKFNEIINCKVPFRLKAIRTLLSYNGDYALNEVDKETVRRYISIATKCNSHRNRRGNMPHGQIQNSNWNHKLITILENYFDRINLSDPIS